MYLINCRLHAPFTGGVESESGCVEIADGRIVSVSERAPEGAAEAFDCGGGTLLPGLIDLHTHITVMSGVGVDAIGDPMQVIVEASEQAKRYLHYGFTTIRDCGSIDRCANYVKNSYPAAFSPVRTSSPAARYSCRAWRTRAAAPGQ